MDPCGIGNERLKRHFINCVCKCLRVDLPSDRQPVDLQQTDFIVSILHETKQYLPTTRQPRIANSFDSA